MRPVNTVETNFRLEPAGGFLTRVKHDFVPPEPVGSLILIPFRITGYDSDCDGSAMVRMENINNEGESSGWTVDSITIDGTSALVVSEEELELMFLTKEVL